MTDINLKTLTPDTSLPTTGFLFGADSQASTNPSVYSTQTVATTLLGSTSLTGDTLTASAPVLNLTQTWNNAAVTFTGVKLNVTDTLSAAASLLMDVGTGGGSFVSKFKIDGGGRVTIASVASGNSLTIGNTNVNTDGTILRVYDAEVNGNGGGIIAAGGANGIFRIGGDTYLSRKAAANFRFGAADAASPVAQTLSVQSIVGGLTGTPNLSAAAYPFTITGAQGTGTGAGGSIVFQVAPAGGSGTAQNALVSAWQITGAGHLICPTDNTYNIGANGANRPFNVFVGNQLFVNDIVLAAGYRNGNGAGVLTGLTSSSPALFIDSPFATPQIGGASFTRINIGGTTSSFPALKRSTTSLQVRLADDSAFTNIQGKLTTDTAYTAGTVTPTGYITIYDSTGTAYRVPCLV